MNDFKFTKACFLFSALLAEAKIFMWGIETSRGDAVRLTVCFLSFGIVGMLLVESFRYVNRKRDAIKTAEAQKTNVGDMPTTATQPTDQPPNTPRINARLVIDSIRGRSVYFHVQIENGPVPIKDVLVSSQTTGAVMMESQPYMPRMLPANGRLSVSGTPTGIFKPKQYTNLVLYVSFNAEVEGAEKKFLYTYRFFVEPNPKPRAIDPENSEYKELQAEVGPQEPSDEIFGRFALKAGTLVFVAPEVNRDGKPNVVNGGNALRHFVFDPEARKVTFQTKMESGRLISLELPLQQSAHGPHVIMLWWDDKKGAEITVDGVKKADKRSE